jgi:hypothetical protein
MATVDEMLEHFRGVQVDQLAWLVDLIQIKDVGRGLSEETIRDLERFTFGFVESPDALPARPATDEIREVVEEVAIHIKRLMQPDDHETWNFDLSLGKFSVRMEWIAGPQVRYVVSDWRDAFRLGVARLIGEHGYLLRQCGWRSCGKIFLGSRSRDRFCSPTCSLSERQARFRTGRTPEELKEKRREAYWQHLERTKGPVAARHAKKTYLRKRQEKDGTL